MSKLDGAIISVALQRAGIGRVELFAREVMKEDALRMYQCASNDTRAIEDDLESRLKAEAKGDDLLCAGYFFVEGDKDADEDVAFPISHAIAAISEHFGIEAEVLERALEPANVATLVSKRDAELASFIKDNPDIVARAEAFRETFGDVQASLTAEFARESVMTNDKETPKPKAGQYDRASAEKLRRLGKGHHLRHDELQEFHAFIGDRFCAYLNDLQIGELMLAWQQLERENKAAEETQPSEGELAAGDDADKLTERLLLAAADYLRSR